MDDPAAVDGAPLQSGTVVGSFRIEQLISTTGDVQLSRARDQHVDRAVLLRTATGPSASRLLDDARRIAAVSHPGLVVVLGAGPTETGSFAAVGDLDAILLGDVGPLTSDEAASVAIDIAGAIGALSDAGMRAPITAETVLVTRTPAGVRGLLDPLRALSPGSSCLSESDAVASTGELAGLVGPTVREPSEAFHRALAEAAFGPAAFIRALAPVSAPPVTFSRTRRRLAIAGCVGLLLLGLVVTVLYERSGGSSKVASPAPAAPQAAAGRVVARIPLRLSGSESPEAFTIVGHSVWIATTAGRLLRVDGATNQLVGSPIDLGKKAPLTAMTSSGGKLYVTQFNGWLLRIDPSTGRVAGRRHLGAHPMAITAANGVLWIASTANDYVNGVVQRVRADTLRPIGAPIDAVVTPLQLRVRGSHAWVLGFPDEELVLARVDAVSRERKLVHVGPDAWSIALGGDTVWISDRFDGTVSALDAVKLAYTRDPLQLPRAAYGLVAVGQDLWVIVSDSIGPTGRLRVERLDQRTGGRVGSPVPIGKGRGGLLSGLGSVWALTATAVTRLAPTSPRPSVLPAPRVGRSPRALRSGVLRAGTWRTTTFVAPLALSTPAFAWVSTHPEPDSLDFQPVGARFAELGIVAPVQVFARDSGALRPVGAPASLLGVLRNNPRLQVGKVLHTNVGGRPALQFELRARHAVRHLEVCGPTPCVLLFPVQDATYSIGSGDVPRVTLLRSAGHTVVIIEGGNGDDPVARATTARLLHTFRFAA